MLPNFTNKLTKASGPIGGHQIAFPRLFHNDAVRASLPSLPAKKYSLLASSDHGADGHGHLYRWDFDDIEGAWTAIGEIYQAPDQLETPHPIYDSVANEVKVSVHVDIPNPDAVYPDTFSSQHARLLRTTDLANFTDAGPMFTGGPGGEHTGYEEIRRLSDGTWETVGSLIGGNVGCYAHYTSPTAEPATWTLARGFPRGNDHVTGAGNELTGTFRSFQSGGQWYRLAGIFARNTLPNLFSAIVAVPIDFGSKRPVGGPITLVSAEAGGDDESIRGYWDIAQINGFWYIVYIGQDAAGDQHILLVRSGTGESSQASLYFPVRSDGEVDRHDSGSTIVDWDAANDPLPSELTVEATEGNDLSSQTAGQYYELKTDSGSLSRVALRMTDKLDPTASETVEFGFTMLRKSSDLQDAFRVGFSDTMPPGTDTAALLWNNGNDDLHYGRWDYLIGGVSQQQDGSLSFPLNSPEIGTNGQTIGPYTQTHGWTIAVRLHDYGRRFTLLINGHVAFSADLSNETLITDAFGWLYVINNSGDFSSVFAWLTRVWSKTYVIAAPTALAAVAGDGQVTLSWTDPPGPKLSQINLYRGTASGGPYTKISGVGGVALGTESYVDDTVDEDTDYFYVARSVDSDANESADSAEAAVQAPTPVGSVCGTVTIGGCR